MHSMKTLPSGGASIAFGCTPTAENAGRCPTPQGAQCFCGNTFASLKVRLPRGASPLLENSPALRGDRND